MYVLVLQGSSRGEKGITDLVLKRFLNGVQKGEPSVRIEVEYLSKADIQSCSGCLSCWIKTQGMCRIRDGMTPLIEKYRKADIIVAATPLYFDSMSSHMKKFWERLLPVMEPYFEKGPEKIRHSIKGNSQKGLFVIGTCAMPEVIQFDGLVLSLKRIAYNLNMNYLGQLLRPESHSLTYMREYGSMIDNVLCSIEKAGEELVKNLSVSRETVNNVQQAITKDPEEFIRVNNSKWDKVLKR